MTTTSIRRRRRFARSKPRRGVRRSPSAKRASLQRGYELGRDAGYADGVREGAHRFHVPFPGTSIVIPTYNQKDYLRQCVESIFAHTPEPFELIVVDNGSEDGTADYLRSMGGKLRYRLNESNLGFAGAINQGLMMARGDTLVLLNNDTVVTANWLANLLACVRGNDRAGLVGPVTNYISGEQLIPTSYDTMEQMHEFARTHNVSNPAAWQQTGRLTGFCVMMRRDVFQRLGYWDEGFEVGNFEDDDYGLRTRLLGLDLIIAKDTFIHHHGSVSIKSLGTGLERVNENNSRFFTAKWTDIAGWFPPYAVRSRLESEHPSSLDYFATCVLVRGVGPDVYWVENGVRRPLAAPVPLEPVRLSQVDVRKWPIGPPVSPEYVAHTLHVLEMSAVLPMEGMLVKTADGLTYQVKGGKLHRVANEWALAAWKLQGRHAYAITDEERGRFVEGPPVVAPPVVRASNL
ncbi:glycosyltransferase family 2 protein [Paenibacillus flagellatus]|uniref:glycosyltransferase family 2 protein n=1 Tax=Paenibacillus flagellatus TaxID=2211139 RepID=UPI001FE3D233|nr:glycosyltransferase family 2 protein [Paenibacillus flagellatus]